MIGWPHCNRTTVRAHGRQRQSGQCCVGPILQIPAGMGGALPIGRQRRAGPDLPRSLPLPRRHSRTGHPRLRGRPGELPLSQCRHGPAGKALAGRRRFPLADFRGKSKKDIFRGAPGAPARARPTTGSDRGCARSIPIHWAALTRSGSTFATHERPVPW